MNFASHYFFQGGASDLFNAGLILADLIPLSQKTPVPLVPSVKKLLQDRSLDSAARELFNGMHSHFAADVIFHRSEFFHNAVDASIRIAGGSGGIPGPLHHILVELFMDRFLVITNDAMVFEMYESFKRSAAASLQIASTHLHLDDETAKTCDRFICSRTVLKYGAFDVISEILKTIGSRVRLQYKEESCIVTRIQQAYEWLETPIKEYFENSQQIFREITLPFTS
jgi:hypothetical protein